MSSSLYWRPVPKLPEGQELPFELKKRLGRRIWNHDGSLTSDEYEVGNELVPYLEGLADGNVPGAAELVAAIEEHGQVQIWIR